MKWKKDEAKRRPQSSGDEDVSMGGDDKDSDLAAVDDDVTTICKSEITNGDRVMPKDDESQSRDNDVTTGDDVTVASLDHIRHLSTESAASSINDVVVTTPVIDGSSDSSSCL